jgi:hypothetical protein
MNQKLKDILRMIAFVALVALGISLLIGLGGWLAGWRNSTQFSNGFFVIGAGFAVFGAYAGLGGFGMRGNVGVNIARTASPASLEERNKQMFADILKGDQIAFLCVGVGTLLILFAVLIPSLFG